MICSDVAPPYIGGGETYVIELGKELIKFGHEVHWLTSKLPKTRNYENYYGIHIHRIPILFSRYYYFPGRQSLPITALIPAVKLAKKMDVLQFNTFIAGAFGWLIGKLSKKPCLLFCHEMFNELWRLIGQNIIEKGLYPFIERIIANAPYDHVMCPSNYSKDTLIKIGLKEDKISVIPHGIDFTIFNPHVSGNEFRKMYKLEGKLVVGFTGRLSLKGTGHSKNLKLLLNAMKLVAKRIPNVKLALGGSNFEGIAPYIKSLKLENHITYIGKMPRLYVPKFIAMCDLIVCPAITDGFCFLLGEASASGKPVVATNRGAHMERVINAYNGLLTNPDPHDFADAIIKVLSDEELAKKLGKGGETYAKKFSWEVSAKKHIQLYEKFQRK